MSVILQIETSTTVCSVALAIDGIVVAVKEANERNIHAGSLTLFIDEVMKKGEISYIDLDAVAVAKGPGSYTGLRIGVSTAKGICFAIDKPLISINTVEMMAYGFMIAHPDYVGLLCPMIDARRMEVYTAVFDDQLNEIQSVSAKIIDEHSFEELIENHSMAFFGDGAEKCMEHFKSNNAHYYGDNFNTAIAMTTFAEKQFSEQKFENVAYFEPFYLKDFIITPSKK